MITSTPLTIIFMVVSVGILVFIITKEMLTSKYKGHLAVPTESPDDSPSVDEAADDEVEYHIVGMKYRRLPPEVFEDFSGGYIEHDAENRHDAHAIAVYNNYEQCVGFIPNPDNEGLYEILKEKGIERIYVRGFIHQGDTAWVGRVFIKEDELE